MIRRFSLAAVVSLMLVTRVLAAAQQPQNPPPQPPAGAANGPEPGPAVKAPGGAGDRTGGAPQNEKPSAEKQASEEARAFLAIGAAPDPAAVKRGQAVFVASCGFCHGSNAHGGNTGPDLVRSVIVLHDKGTAKEITPVIRNGRPGKGMPSFPNLTDAQIKDIAAFLLSRNQAAANRMDYKILNIVTGDPKLGEAYFAAHCASCHSATGDLAHIAGKYQPEKLQSRFLYPRNSDDSGGEGDPHAEKTVTVTLASGQSFVGKLGHVDDFSVSLTDPSGVYHSWLFGAEPGIKVQVHDPLAEHAALLKQYSNADMHNILAYLETLK